jgi:hypothetical protein
MITSNCECPLGAAIPAIPVNACLENFGQIQKVAFQRLSNGTTKNTIPATGTTSITALAAWTALLTAADGKKVAVSPYLVSAVVEPGGAITSGGGNDSIDGIEEVNGAEPAAFTAVIKKSPQNTIAALKKLMCEGELGVYMFNEFGQIGCIKTGTTTAVCSPIPIRSLFISDKGFGGKTDPDTNNIQWSFPPNYSDGFSVITPDFNPVADLVAA